MRLLNFVFTIIKQVCKENKPMFRVTDADGNRHISMIAT